MRYLPPYSPGINPIEKAISKLKAVCANRRPNRRRPDEGAPSLRRHLSNLPNAQFTSPPAAMIQLDRSYPIEGFAADVTIADVD